MRVNSITSLGYVASFIGGTALFLTACSASSDSGEPQSASGATETPGATGEAQVQGCIAPTNAEWQWVGDSFNAFSGAQGSFAFNRDPSTNAVAVCVSPALNQSSVVLKFVHTQSDLETMESTDSTVAGGGGYAGASIDAKARQFLEQKVSLTSDSINLVVRVTNPLKVVTMDASVQLSPDVDAQLALSDGKLRVHNTYGDVYVKSAQLGHYLFLVYHATITRSDKYNKRLLELAVKAKYANATSNASLSFENHTEAEVKDMLSCVRVDISAESTVAIPISFDPNKPTEIKSAMDTFWSAANADNARGTRFELEPFGRRNGRTEADFLDWRPTASALADTGKQLAGVEEIASSGTDFRDLSARAGSLAALMRRMIDRTVNPPLPPNVPDYVLGEMGRSVSIGYPLVMNDAKDHATRLAQAVLIKAGRQEGLCLGRGLEGAGTAGEKLFGEECNGREDQLYVFDQASKQVQSVSGQCVTISNGTATSGDLALSPCTGSQWQQWIVEAHSVKISAFSLRTVSFIDSVLGTSLRATSGTPARAAGWSRGDYVQYDWVPRTASSVGF
jgi:hypothetical protein